jgi:K+-sensing histidine kinase KdpD
MLERLAEARSPAVLFAHESWRTGEGIVSVVDESDGPAVALRTAVRLAARAHAPLSLLVEAATTDERAKLTALATDVVAAAGVELRASQRVVRVTPDTVARAAEGARLLVLPRREAARGAGFMSRLLMRLRTPLLLVDSAAAASVATASRATDPAPPTATRVE